MKLSQWAEKVGIGPTASSAGSKTPVEIGVARSLKRELVYGYLSIN